MRQCYFCGYIFHETFEVFRSTLCPKCHKEVKVCKNCKFYSPGSHWDCGETIDEQVKEKDRANFCSYFQFRQTTDEQGKEKKLKQEDAKDAFDKLFGD